MLGSLYILQEKKYAKIGSSMEVKNRFSHYKTIFRDFDNSVFKAWEIKILKSPYNCYQLDYIIRKISMKIKYPYRHYDGSGGREHYYFDTEKNLVDMLTCMKIKFEIKGFDLNNLKLEYDKKTNYNEECVRDEIIVNDDIIEQITNQCIYTLKDWQNELTVNFKKIINSDQKSSIFISPTGAGKSFMMIYLSLLYIQENKKDVMIVSQRKEILMDLKEIIKEHHNKFVISNLISILPSDIDIIEIVNKKGTSNILNNKTKKNRIYIVNNSKFIASNAFKDYEKLNFGEIKLVFDDECHNSGAEKINKFMEYLKNIGIKLIGLSATPSRMQEKNKENTLKLYGDGTTLNILYEMTYLRCLDKQYIALVKWMILSISKKDVVTGDVMEGDIDENDDKKSKKKTCSKLNKGGMMKILPEIRELVKKSLFKKGIFYFGSTDALIEFYDWFKDQIIKYDELKDIKLFVTFSNQDKFDKVGMDKQEMEQQIMNFKKRKDNAILLSVFRACEGFDDKKLDFAIRMYSAEKPSIVQELQRMGRLARIYEGKTHSTYASLEIEDKDDLKDQFIKVLAGVMCMINLFGRKDHTTGEAEEYNIITVDKIIEIGDKYVLDPSKLRNEIKNQTRVMNGTNSFKAVINKIKKLGKFDIECTDFWGEYDKIRNKEYMGLPIDHGELHREYKEYFEKKTWYEILGINTPLWYNENEIIKNVQKINKNIYTKKEYLKIIKMDNKLPIAPEYYYKYGFDYRTLKRKERKEFL